jgi:hypothetical protein
MELGLRDEQHQVTGTGSQLDERRQGHPWEFRERVLVLTPDLEELAARDATSKDGRPRTDDRSDSTTDRDPRFDDAEAPSEGEGGSGLDQEREEGRDDATNENTVDDVVEQRSVEEDSNDEA